LQLDQPASPVGGARQLLVSDLNSEATRALGDELLLRSLRSITSLSSSIAESRRCRAAPRCMGRMFESDRCTVVGFGDRLIARPSVDLSSAEA
jgi:hypothetical protein